MNGDTGLSVNLEVVSSINDPPSVTTPTFTWAVGTPLSFDLNLLVDDPDGDPLTYSQFTDGTPFVIDMTPGGTITWITGLDPDGTLKGTAPTAAEIGNHVINFQANDGVNGDTGLSVNLVVVESIPAVSLSIFPSSFPETGGSAQVTATLNQIATADVVVNLGFTGVAGLNTDYTASANTITIPMGSTSASIVLTAIHDTLVEGNESITVSITGVTNATTAIGTASTWIIDDDFPVTVNNPPIYNDIAYTIPENSPKDMLVGVHTGTDPEGTALTYSIIGGNTDNAFSIDPGTGRITVNNSAALDFETIPVFTLTIRATDMGGLSDTALVTISLTDVNEAPVAEDTEFVIPENSPEDTQVGTITASDPEGDDLVYSIIDGNTGDAFSIDPQTGLISVNNPDMLDYETTPEFTLLVQITDNGDPAQSKVITVTVRLEDVEELPPVYNDTEFILPENSPYGSFVGQQIAHDPENGPLTYTILSGNTGNAFAMDPETGVITVNEEFMIDYESWPVFTLTAQATDQDGMSDTAILTIRLLDLNEPPVADAPEFTLPENSPAGTGVGVLQAGDPENDPLTYAIVGGNTGDAFAIDPETGLITVNSSAPLDYESHPVFTLLVQISDNRDPALSTVTTVTIRLTDVVEGLVAVDDHIVTDEDHAVVIPVLDNDLTDDESTVILRVVSVDDSGTLGRVILNANGTVTYNPTENATLQSLAPGESMTDTFTYTISDQLGRTDSATVTVTVNGVNDLPVIQGTVSGQQVQTDQTIAPFARFVITDADGADEVQSVTIRLDNPGNGVFSVLNGFTDAGNGVYTFIGTTAAVQEAIRGLVFDPAGEGRTVFTISVLNHGQGPVVDARTSVTASSVVAPPTIWFPGDPDDGYWRWGHTEKPWGWGFRGDIWEWDFQRDVAYIPGYPVGLNYESAELGMFIKDPVPRIDTNPYAPKEIFTENHIPVFELRQIRLPDLDFGFDDTCEDVYGLVNRMIQEAKTLEMGNGEWGTGE